MFQSLRMCTVPRQGSALVGASSQKQTNKQQNHETLLSQFPFAVGYINNQLTWWGFNSSYFLIVFS